MQVRRFRFSEALAFALVTAALACPTTARAQACCAGAGALTPGRLAPHEDALVGIQSRASSVVGSFDDGGRYAASPRGVGELDFEQDLFGALRVLRHGQVALLVPFVETRRRTPSDGAAFGGGIGDVNLSARYDFFLAGVSRTLPGIALLGGVTLPTGTPVESARRSLAVDATGVGAFQGNFGVALEQSFGAWLLNLTALVAKRAGRNVQGVDETLGTQLVTIAGVAHSFPNDAALAAFASYSIEGDATINGADAAGSARRIFLASVSGVWPITDHWRIQGSIFTNPPFSSFGRNMPATSGLTYTLVRSWM